MIRQECEQQIASLRSRVDALEATVNQLLSKHEKPRTQAIDRPAYVSETAWKDWMAVRKEKRAGPITRTVMNAVIRESEKAGISVEDAIVICAERGWQGFKAEWIDRDSKTRQQPTFREKTAQQAADRIAEFSPHVADRMARRHVTIDVASKNDNLIEGH